MHRFFNRFSIFFALIGLVVFIGACGAPTLESQVERFKRISDRLDLLGTKQPQFKLDIDRKKAEFAAELEQAKAKAGEEGARAVAALCSRMEAFENGLNPQPATTTQPGGKLGPAQPGAPTQPQPAAGGKLGGAAPAPAPAPAPAAGGSGFGSAPAPAPAPTPAPAPAPAGGSGFGSAPAPAPAPTPAPAPAPTPAPAPGGSGFGGQ